MKFDPIKYLQDYHIKYWTGGKNVSQGWIGIACPLCGDLSSHGGFNIEGGYYSCWLCGGHSLIKVIRALEGISHDEAKKRIEEYQSHIPTNVRTPETPRKNDISFPIGTSTINVRHRRYLENRGFDPDEIQEKYHILGTGPLAFIKINERKINYSNRIIIPIIHQNQIVSYQGRDITGKSDLRYRTCPRSEEVMHHKHILYNFDNCEDTAIIMEGVFDVWRWGDGAVCTFGIQFTKEQELQLVSSKIRRALVLFDCEPQAQKQAIELVNLLKNSTGIIANNHFIPDKDPAELSDEEVWKIKLKYKI